MKIDCPHCGVGGSVEDSLAGKKLRCPKCSKVFLVPDELLPAPGDTGMMRQEILYSDEAQQRPSVAEQAEPSIDSVEQEPEEEGLLEEDAVETEPAEQPVEVEQPVEADVTEEEDMIGEESVTEDDSNLQPCSVCGQSFVSEFLVEIDSRLYCALCQPEKEEEAELQEEEEPLDIVEESVFGEEDDSGDEDAGGEETDEEEVEFETCSQCGESLHPEFLETIGSKRYCAFCAPADEEEDNELMAAGDLLHDEEFAEAGEPESIETLEREEDDFAAEDSLSDLCAVCGESFHPDFLQEVDSKLYCGLCQPEVIEIPVEDADDEVVAPTSELMETADAEGEEYEAEAEAEDELSDEADFTIGEVLKEAWQKTKGVKGAIWGGVLFMYLVLFAIGFGAAMALQGGNLTADPSTAMGINVGVQVFTTWLSTIFSAGVMLIGVRRALEQRVSWKMVFAGFSKALSITVALILQIILITIGLLLLVLPGIYLSVGYALTLPLILEKGLGPWQALEASRKAIHKRWWSVLGLYLVMGLIYLVSAIPLGIGLIWTVPMFFMVIGVLYRLFFASFPAEEEVFGGEDDTMEDAGELEF